MDGACGPVNNRVMLLEPENPNSTGTWGDAMRRPLSLGTIETWIVHVCHSEGEWARQKD
jgi:hypothetical protein